MGFTQRSKEQREGFDKERAESSRVPAISNRNFVALVPNSSVPHNSRIAKLNPLTRQDMSINTLRKRLKTIRNHTCDPAGKSGFPV